MYMGTSEPSGQPDKTWGGGPCKRRASHPVCGDNIDKLTSPDLHYY